MAFIISGTDKGAVTFPVDDFTQAVRTHWGGSVESVSRAEDGRQIADIQPSGESGFSIRLDPQGSSISTDGTDEQTADVALWSLTLLPRDHEPVILYDGNGFRALQEGMSLAEVWSSWQDF